MLSVRWLAPDLVKFYTALLRSLLHIAFSSFFPSKAAEYKSSDVRPSAFCLTSDVSNVSAEYLPVQSY
jgi:hypothetical protein